MQLFRVTPEPKVRAFDGVGASTFPGRWNVRHRRTVYASSGIPLAILELLARSGAEPLRAMLAYPLEVPDRLLDRLDLRRLPRFWRSLGGRDDCRALGEEWRASGSSVGFIVPSAVVPEGYDFGDFNVVLNPERVGFSRVAIGEPIPLELDDRIAPRPSCYGR